MCGERRSVSARHRTASTLSPLASARRSSSVANRSLSFSAAASYSARSQCSRSVATYPGNVCRLLSLVRESSFGGRCAVAEVSDACPEFPPLLTLIGRQLGKPLVIAQPD